MDRKADDHPMMQGPGFGQGEDPPVTRGPFHFSAGNQAESGRRLSFSLHPAIPSVEVLALPPRLKKLERGSVLQFGLSYKFVDNQYQPVVSGDDGETAWRAAILFGDKLDWPITSLVALSSADPSGLASAGVLSRTPVAIKGRASYEQLNHVAFAVFEALDKREPGLWSIWAGKSESVIPANALSPDLAFRLRLNQSLLLPHPTVPQEDVLAFRNKNIAKMRRLRVELDNTALQVARNGWEPCETNLAIQRLDIAIAEYLEEARRPNWRKTIAGLELSMNWLGAGMGSAFAAAGMATGLPLTGALLGVAGAVGSSAALSSAPGIKSLKSKSPFAYLLAIEKEFGD